MEAISKLKRQTQNFVNEHGIYPEIQVSDRFWNKYPHEIAELANKGASIEVIGNLIKEESFLIEYPENQHTSIETLEDLKREVDKLIDQGKGHWPVRFSPYDGRCYLRIKLCPIVPGKAPLKGLELFSDFDGAPEGEHILILFGRDKLE